MYYNYRDFNRNLTDLEDIENAYTSFNPENVTHKIFLNDLPSNTKEEIERVDRLVTTIYDQIDTITNIPQCACGHYKRGYNLGKICEYCLTTVCTVAESPIVSNVYIKVPEDDLFFVSPIFWMQLNHLLGKGRGKSYNLTDYIFNVPFKDKTGLPKTTLKKIQYLEEIGWQRGIKYLYHNFDKFLEILPEISSKSELTPGTIELFRKNKDALLPKVIPLITKSFLVIEKVNKSTYSLLSFGNILDAARTALTFSKTTSSRVLENKCISISRNLAIGFDGILTNLLSKKKGFFRGTWFSSKVILSSARTVITTLNKPHHYKELHIPWNVGIEMLRIHITRKLIERGYTESDTRKIINYSINNYTVLMDEILTELINDSPFQLPEYGYNPNKKGLPCIFQRNPTLLRLSAQFFLITYIKGMRLISNSYISDLSDQTISMSPLCLKGPNADCDGDAMNLQLLTVKDIQEAATMLSSHYGIFDHSDIEKLSPVLSQPDAPMYVLNYFVNNY